MEKKSFPYGRAISIALFLFAFFILSSDDVIEFIRQFMGEGVGGMFAYVVVLVFAVVVAPVTVLPLIPVASALFGPFLTGVLSVIGWTLGAYIAYLLARHVGRPVLRYFVPLEKIDALEQKFRRGDEFVGLLLLRIVTPVDLLSYAVGLFTSIKAKTYIVATALGVAPFSFIFAYGGQALADLSFGQLFAAVIVGATLFFIVFHYLRKSSPANASID